MEATIGRRVRGVREKRERIRTAAAALFDEHGYEGVTTQEISDRADVATGTLFRYAATKAELFLMVYNEEFRAAIDDGARRADEQPTLAAAVSAQVEAVVTGARNAPISAAYQRELLFGSTTQEHRAEGLALVAALEEALTRRLVDGVPDPTGDHETHRLAATRAARSVFAVLNLLLVQPLTGAHGDRDLITELRAQVEQIVAGFLAQTAGSAPPTDAPRRPHPSGT